MISTATRPAWQVPLALCAWVVLLYAGSLDNSFHYDDTHSLVDNPSVRSLTNLGRFFVDPSAFSASPDTRMYRPLLLVTYAVNHALGGYDAFGYHLLNVLLHAINACLVWWVGRRVLGSHDTALAAALIFATHPVVSEPVNYVSSRSTLLAALFVLAGMLILVHTAARPGWRHHLGLTLCAAAALLSKSVGIVLLPGAVLWLWLLGPGGRASWSLLAGPAVAGVAYVIGTRAIVGKALLEPVRSHAEQVATQLKAVPFYAYTNLMPAHLSVEPQFSTADLWSLTPLVSLLLALCMAASVLVLRRLCPAAAFGAAWFAVTLAPSSVVPLNVLVNEHRLYLPLVGGTFLASALLGAAGPRLRPFAPVLLVIWAVMVWQRGNDWDTEESIWLDAARKGPAMSRVHVNLGKGYLESGSYEQAINASRRGLELDPDLALPHYNIGTAYLSMERYDEAIASFEVALELQPGMLEAMNNLGTSYQNSRQYDRAEAVFRDALQLHDWSQLHHNLGAVFLASGQADSAAAHFQLAHDAEPADRETMEGLARALIGAERLQHARQLLDRGLRRLPGDTELLRLLAQTQISMGRDVDALTTFQRSGLPTQDAHLRIGDAARKRHDWRRARHQYEQGLQVAPDDARLLDGLGTVHVAEGDRRMALELFRRAASYDPQLASPFRNIGLVNLQHQRLPEALAALERARDLDDMDGKTWELLGRAYAGSGQGEAAATAYRRALMLLPDRLELYGSLGFLLLEQAHWNEAVTVLETLLRRDPTQVEAYVNLASARLNLGDGAGAAAAYEQFLGRYLTDDDMRRKVQRQLQLLQQGGTEGEMD